MSQGAGDAGAKCADIAIGVLPRAQILPSNTLRFYLSGTQSWEARFDRARLRLDDHAGRAISAPFLVLSQDLWSRDGRRLTILMEPGRIKRGMGADPAHEPALVEGRCYSLVFEAAGAVARHDFRVGEAVRSPLDEALWRITPPTVGDLSPLLIRFDRVMDAALCETEIAVLGPSGERLLASTTLGSSGAVALVVPERPWRSGVHSLVVSSRLEDVCGNRLGEALDHDCAVDGRPRAGAVRFSPTARKEAASGSRQEAMA